MRISLDWVGDCIQLCNTTPSELSELLTLSTVEVEGILEEGDDAILEIDNKSLTNRPDLWGHFGISRELSAILDVSLTPLREHDVAWTASDLLDWIAPDVCRRFAVVPLDVEPGAATPQWIATRLTHAGLQPTGLFYVDLGNYAMLTTGQPVHVYDRDAIKGPISVDWSNPGEEVVALYGEAPISLGKVPVVRDRTRVLSIAGVLGGQDSAPSASSTRLLVECGAFIGSEVRKSSQALQIRTEASTRCEKGIDTQRIDQTVALFLALAQEEQTSVRIHAGQDITNEQTQPVTVEVTHDYLTSRLGLRLPLLQIQSGLARLGFKAVEIARHTLAVTAPTWRSTGDIQGPHDILEEVARLHGYEKLPRRDISVLLRPARSSNMRTISRQVTETLALRGNLNQAVTYPWVRDRTANLVGIHTEELIHFEGAPSPDRNSLRPSLLSGLLEVIQVNLQSDPEPHLFEVGTVFGGSDQLPNAESQHVGALVCGTDPIALFREIKGLADLLRSECGVVGTSWEGVWEQPWAIPQSGISLVSGGIVVGGAAVISPEIVAAIASTSLFVAYLELNLDDLTLEATGTKMYRRIIEFPPAEFDVSVVLDDAYSWAEVEALIWPLDSSVVRVQYLGEFRGNWVPNGHRSLSLRVVLQSPNGTLTGQQITDVQDRVVAVLSERLGATQR